MVRVWVAGKTVWSSCYTCAISEHSGDKGLITKRYINSSVYLLTYLHTESLKTEAYDRLLTGKSIKPLWLSIDVNLTRFPQSILHSICSQLFNGRSSILEIDSHKIADVLPIDGNPKAARRAWYDKVFDRLYGSRESVHLVMVVVMVLKWHRRFQASRWWWRQIAGWWWRNSVWCYGKCYNTEKKLSLFIYSFILEL